MLIIWQKERNKTPRISIWVGSTFSGLLDWFEEYEAIIVGRLGEPYNLRNLQSKVNSLAIGNTEEIRQWSLVLELKGKLNIEDEEYYSGGKKCLEGSGKKVRSFWIDLGL